MHVSGSGCITHIMCVQVPTQDKTLHQGHLESGFQFQVVIQSVCWDLSMSPLQKLQVLLIEKPALLLWSAMSVKGIFVMCMFVYLNACKRAY